MQRQTMENRLRKKRLLATVDHVRSLKADVETAKTDQERKAAERLLEQAEALRKGLAGRRWGKHRVPEERIDVQLGEDLRPSLRELKVRSPHPRVYLSISTELVLMDRTLRLKGTCSRTAS
jgi:nucleolar protein 53